MDLVFQDTLSEASSTALISHTPALGGAWTSGSLINVNSTGASTTSTSSRTGVSNFPTPTGDFEIDFSFIAPGITTGAWRTKVYFSDGGVGYGASVRWVSGVSYVDIYEIAGSTNVASFAGSPSVWAGSTNTIRISYIGGITSVYLNGTLLGTSNTAVPPSGGAGFLSFELLATVSSTPPLYLTDIEVYAGATVIPDDVEQPIDIIITAVGDVSQPLDVSIATPWGYWGGNVIQPITLSFISTGDVDQSIDISIAAPQGDVVQPIDIRMIGFGDVSQAVDISLRDPLARTTRCKIRTFVAGEEISPRTTGEGSSRAEEGGARIATIVLVPEVGAIDAEAMTGLPVVIDALLYEGDAYATRRLFTGKVEKPVWNPSRGTLELSCTDDLQNKQAAQTRAALAAITGGRYNVSVQGEQQNNYEYAQALMATVSGSLDADPFGALRVTPWHVTDVWRTYNLANTEQGSIDFTLADKTGIINKITGTFEYRFTRLHRRTAKFNFTGDMQITVQYGLPLLARSTVEAALEATGWNFYYGGSAIGPGGGGEAPKLVTDGQPVTPNISYRPYPESYDLPGGGLWYQKETDTTCLGFSCSMFRRWAQTVTETYVLTVTAPESITVNGVRSREDRASVASEWDASSWESDAGASPSLPVTGKHATLDYAPDAGTDDRDAAIATFLDTLKVRIDASHRSGRARARTWLTPELDLDKRVRIESPKGEAEGKVISVEHNWDMTRGRFTTDFEIAVTRHGGVGLTPPADTPSVAPAAPAVPVPSTSALAALYDSPSIHVGGLADSPEEDPDWTGWIVNVPASYNVDDPGSSAPSINPETQKTERTIINDPYRGGAANPLYRADKVYATTGFRVKLPAIEDEARDASAPQVRSNYTLAIPQDDFTLTA